MASSSFHSLAYSLNNLSYNAKIDKERCDGLLLDAQARRDQAAIALTVAQRELSDRAGNAEADFQSVALMANKFLELMRPFDAAESDIRMVQSMQAKINSRQYAEYAEQLAGLSLERTGRVERIRGVVDKIPDAHKALIGKELCNPDLPVRVVKEDKCIFKVGEIVGCTATYFSRYGDQCIGSVVVGVAEEYDRYSGTLKPYYHVARSLECEDIDYDVLYVDDAQLFKVHVA